MAGISELSDIDREILRLLLDNPRISYREIARRIGVSVTTVSKKVRGLAGSGIIRGYAVILGEHVLEQMNCFILYVKVSSTHDMRSVAEGIARIDGICRVYVTTGEYPVKAFGAVSRREEVTKTIGSVLRLEGVDEVRTEWIIHHVKEDYPRPEL